jgi:hypothetical protein
MVLPPWMISYLHHRVARRAAYISGQLTLQLEVGKSPELVRIEDRYRTDQIKRIERSRHL